MFKLFGVTSEDKVIDLDQEINIEDELQEETGQVAVDILETPYELIVLAPIAGIELEDIDLSFNKSVLTISGFRTKPEIYSDDIIIKNSECFWGKFVRNIILPENLDFDNIKASLENNLLIITIQKLRFSSQNIKINRVEM
ncbi:MAG: Hsp20/alpha crystallin family protein [Candidatus Gracilibacteria bacterium]